MPYRSASLQRPAGATGRPRAMLGVACVAALAAAVVVGVAPVRPPRSWRQGPAGRAATLAHAGTLASGAQVSVLYGRGERAAVLRLPGRLVRRGADVVRVPEVVPARDAVALMPDGAWAIDADGRCFDASSAATVAACARRPCAEPRSAAHGRVVQITAEGSGRFEDGAIAQLRDGRWSHFADARVVDLAAVALRSDGVVVVGAPGWVDPAEAAVPTFEDARFRVPEPVEVAAASDERMACVRGRRGDLRCGLVGITNEHCDQFDDGCDEPFFSHIDVELRPAVRAARVAVDREEVCVIDAGQRLLCGVAGAASDRIDGPWAVDLSPVAGVDQVTEVALAAGVRCVRSESGESRCWGPSLRGGGVQRREAPVAVAGLDAVGRLVSFGDHVCALQRGVVSCWGGRATTAEAHPRALLTGPVAEMVAFDDTLCLGLRDGTLQCHTGGPFAAPTVSDEAPPRGLHALAPAGGGLLLLDDRAQAWVTAARAGTMRFVRVAAFDGYEHVISYWGTVCATRRGEVLCPSGDEASGLNDYQRPRELASTRERLRHDLPELVSGAGTVALSHLTRHPPSNDLCDGVAESLRAAIGGDLRAHAAGGYECALGTPGRVACRWAAQVIEAGAADLGRIDGDDATRLVPGLDDAVEIAVTNGGLACARRASGRVVCWGRNVGGVLTPEVSAREPRFFTPDELLARAAR